MGNVSVENHVVHFILGVASYWFGLVTGAFLLYQLIDGLKFRYRVVRNGADTDDIPLDLLLFSVGALLPRAASAATMKHRAVS